MISPEIIEKVRQSIDIVDIIGEHVQLKPAGIYFKGLSPFNKEKTPSFMVSRQRQSFKCYSSGHGGDVFKFLMLHEHLDFPAAVRRLAERARVEIPQTFAEQKEGISRGAKEALLALHNHIATYWRDLLLNDPRAKSARDYLKNRKIPSNWIDDFCLGYAPNEWDETLIWARGKGFTQQQLLDAGLVAQADSGRFYGRFRDRLMFPIANDVGQIIAFSGRQLNQNANSPKYMNSPETILFKKSRILFGLDRAKRAILDAKQAILCEGQIDVLRCHSVGIANVVAPLGTAFTEEHCQILRRLTDRIILCLDADRAGQSTTERLGPMLLSMEGDLPTYLQSELGIQVIQLPAGEDPDSFITAHGVKAFQALLNKPIDYLDFYIRHLLIKRGDGSPVSRRRVSEEVVRLLALVGHEVVRDQLILQASNRLNISRAILSKQLEQFKKSGTKPLHAQKYAPTATAEQIQVHPRVQAVLQIILVFPELIASLQRVYQTSWVEDLPGGELLNRLIEAYTNDQWSSWSNVYPLLSSEEQNYLAGLDVESLQSISFTEEELAKSMKALELDYLSRQIEQLGQKNSFPDATEEQIRIRTQKINQLFRRKSELTRRFS